MDEYLTGLENVVMVARLYGLAPRDARCRADDVLECIRLTEVADHRVDTYSGGCGAVWTSPPRSSVDPT